MSRTALTVVKAHRTPRADYIPWSWFEVFKQMNFAIWTQPAAFYRVAGYAFV